MSKQKKPRSSSEAEEMEQLVLPPDSFSIRDSRIENEAEESQDPDGELEPNGELAQSFVPAPALTRSHVPVRHGQLASFIQEHADFAAESRIDEARRLLALAQEHGIHTTLNSVNQSLGAQRNRKLASVRQKSLVPPLHSAPAPAHRGIRKTARRAAPAQHNVRAVLDAIELLKSTVNQLAAENADYRAKLSKISTFLD